MFISIEMRGTDQSWGSGDREEGEEEELGVAILCHIPNTM